MRAAAYPHPTPHRGLLSRQIKHFINCILNTCFKLVRSLSSFQPLASYLELPLPAPWEAPDGVQAGASPGSCGSLLRVRGPAAFGDSVFPRYFPERSPLPASVGPQSKAGEDGEEGPPSSVLAKCVGGPAPRAQARALRRLSPRGSQARAKLEPCSRRPKEGVRPGSSPRRLRFLCLLAYQAIQADGSSPAWSPVRPQAMNSCAAQRRGSVGLS